jgi:membrane protein
MDGRRFAGPVVNRREVAHGLGPGPGHAGPGRSGQARSWGSSVGSIVRHPGRLMNINAPIPPLVKEGPLLNARCAHIGAAWGKIWGVRWLDQIEAGVDRTVAGARKRSAVIDHTWLAVDRFVDVLGGRLAAAISYYAFFAAFSLGVFGYSVLGRLLGSSESSVLAAINSYLEGSLPWVADTARSVGRGEVTAISGAALLLAGVGWVETLRSSLRAVWRFDQHPGNWIIRRLVDLGMLFGLGILLGLSLAMSWALDQLIGLLAPDTNLGEMLLRPIGPLLEFMVNVVLAAALLTAVPRVRLSPRRLVVPTLLVAAGIQLLNTVGRLFIARSEGRPVYGVVAGSVGLLVYLYVLNQLILFGAAVAATSTVGSVRDLGGRPSSALPGFIPPDDAPPENTGEPRGTDRP